MFEDNFIRIYRMPEKLTDGYCFGAGTPITFTNVDWFNAPKDNAREKIEAFIKGRIYYSQTASFLVLGDTPETVFVIHGDEPGKPTAA